VPDERLFKLTIYAEGELRDSEGNLISSEPVEIEQVVTEGQAQELMISAELEERIRAATENREPVSDSRTISHKPG
jgi:hypothetical protein